MRWSQLVIGWLLGLCVLALVVVVAYNEFIPDAEQGMYIRAVEAPEDEYVYALDVERTRMEVPELAEGLDEASATGEADVRGDASNQAYDYLAQVQREDPRTTSQVNGVIVEWKGRTFQCTSYTS